MENLKDEATHIDIDGDLWKDVVFDSEGNAEEGVYLKDMTWRRSYISGLDLKPIEKKEMKEFLVNHDGKWTLLLLDSDTEENSYRVAVPSGADWAYKNTRGKIITMNGEIGDSFIRDLVWQRSETEESSETVKVTIDELKHRVYKKDVSHLKIVDVYRVLELFDVKSHAVGHAIKKLLLSGDRGAKDEAQDIQEAIDSLIRYQEMKNEDE